MQDQDVGRDAGSGCRIGMRAGMQNRDVSRDAGLGCRLGCWMGMRAGMLDRDAGRDAGWDAGSGCWIGMLGRDAGRDAEPPAPSPGPAAARRDTAAGWDLRCQKAKKRFKISVWGFNSPRPRGVRILR